MDGHVRITYVHIFSNEVNLDPIFRTKIHIHMKRSLSLSS